MLFSQSFAPIVKCHCYEDGFILSLLAENCRHKLYQDLHSKNFRCIIKQLFLINICYKYCVVATCNFLCLRWLTFCFKAYAAGREMLSCLAHMFWAASYVIFFLRLHVPGSAFCCPWFCLVYTGLMLLLIAANTVVTQDSRMFVNAVWFYCAALCINFLVKVISEKPCICPGQHGNLTDLQQTLVPSILARPEPKWPVWLLSNGGP